MESADTGEDKIDLEEGELEDESGDETGGQKEQIKKDENRKAVKSSTGGGRGGKSKEASRKHKNDSSDARKPDGGSKSGKRGESKKPPTRSREFSKEKDSDKRNDAKVKRKSKENPSFEDELNEYKQLNSHRGRRHSHSGDSDSGHGDSGGHSPDARRHRGSRDPRPNAPSSSSSRPPFKRRKEEFRPPKEKKIPCKFFVEGRCKYGDQCPFSHNIPQTKKLEACKFYMGGYCQKGVNCVYMHSEFPCKFFHTGQRCYSGDACKFSHDTLSTEQKTALDRLLEKENRDSYSRGHRNDALKEGPEGHHHVTDSPAKLANSFLENLSRDLLGPSAENESPNWNNNTRRRPEFFRETLYGEDRNRYPEERQYGEEVENKPETSSARLENGENELEGFGQGESPHEGSSHQHGTADASKSLPKRQRELFLRLQQRAQHGVARQVSEAEGSYDAGTGGNQEDEMFEPKGEGQHEENFPKPESSVVKTHWNESDDEDEGNDQVLANSLKRLQEAPKESRWSRPLSSHPPARAPFPAQNYPRSQPEQFPPANAPYGQPAHAPFYPPVDPPVNHERPAPFDGREEFTNRGKTLLPLPPPAREPLLMPPAPVEVYPPYSQTALQGGLLAPPTGQYNEYEDPNWNYAQPSPVDPRLKSPPHPHTPVPVVQANSYPPTPLQPGYGRPPAVYNPPAPSTAPPYTVPSYSYPAPTPGTTHDTAYPGGYPGQMPVHSQYVPPYGSAVPSVPSTGLLPGMATTGDPRLQRSTASEIASPPQDMHVPSALGSVLNTPAIEAVIQKLLAEKELGKKTEKEAVPVVPELEGSLAKNTDPPLYRLEPIETCKPNMKEVYFRVSAYRSTDELNRDPRLSKIIPVLTSDEMDRSKTVAAPAPSVVSPAEPQEQEDSTKASLEFDAFTALLQQALGNSKKRNPDDVDKELSPNSKKNRRVAASAPMDTYS
ncbi:uncharacterized protein LOC129583000 [Paramacrobiotus metropolitanus]|uniref:uncharacterized protein LOC129583000 n=1 Tax=Paramacrobiotus metropolitanus TaxID=2943436 RepID=UPI002445B96F|nr:uncharacterized protein LOC129583000 [Paramacrobiotus metropolitanus]XP_055330639.1 uncharacterized protein LOC129583000 [Paramacrobiotus metropolitanus]XP_055330646.1 uncharacterized protein LOC129583000 [Paramacrobiotus metropolitanus]XP_055330656.1 uncharacterized protein LOC129583000 [Paramacrobiotus metropolitanus]